MLSLQVVYNDRRKVEAMVRRSLPMMKNFKEFEYGFKIRDKSRPNDWCGRWLLPSACRLLTEWVSRHRAGPVLACMLSCGHLQYSNQATSGITQGHAFVQCVRSVLLGTAR